MPFNPSFTILTFVFAPDGGAMNWTAFHGPAVRGAFGNRLRTITCVTGAPTCDDCAFADSCPYVRIFETRNTGHAARLTGTATAPHPFVIKTQDGQVVAGDADHKDATPPHPFVIKTPRVDRNRAYLGLTLVGMAIADLPLIIEALRRVGAEWGRGTLAAASGACPLRLEHVLVRTAQGQDRPLFTGQTWPATLSPSLTLADLAHATGDAPVDRVRLQFLTPTVIVANGRALREPTPHAFFERLFHRLDTLSSAFCASPLDKETLASLRATASQVRVAHAELAWIAASRYSTRQRTHIPLDGIVGVWELSGPLAPLLPYVLAGQAVGVGKNTSSGCGDFVVTKVWTAAA